MATGTGAYPMDLAVETGEGFTGRNPSQSLGGPPARQSAIARDAFCLCRLTPVCRMA